MQQKVQETGTISLYESFTILYLSIQWTSLVNFPGIRTHSFTDLYSPDNISHDRVSMNGVLCQNGALL
jgi:hypothetical protein